MPVVELRSRVVLFEHEGWLRRRLFGFCYFILWRVLLLFGNLFLGKS